MNRHLPTRKIQVQDVKGSIHGLFPKYTQHNGYDEHIDKKRENNNTPFNSPLAEPADNNAKMTPSKIVSTLKGLLLQYRNSYLPGKKLKNEKLSNLAKAIRKFISSFRYSHIKHACRQSIQQAILDKKFESRLFKSSFAPSNTDQLTISSPQKAFGLGYKPIAVRLLRTILNHLPEKLEHYSFTDFGSGAGRALLIASCYPFKTVSGAEYAKELHEACLSNIAHFPRSLMQCRNVSCHWQDATTMPLNKDKAVFLFHAPFSIELYQEMISKITQSYKEQPRKIYLIFVDTNEEEQLDCLMKSCKVYESFTIKALKGWKCLWLNNSRVKIYRTVFRERK